MANETKEPQVEPVVETPKDVIEPRQLTAEEIMELQELHRIASTRRFEATQVKGNTALIPDGQRFAAQLDALARLLLNTKNHWLSQKLRECGWPTEQNVTIDLKTGYITPQTTNETGDSN